MITGIWILVALYNFTGNPQDVQTARGGIYTTATECAAQAALGTRLGGPEVQYRCLKVSK